MNIVVTLDDVREFAFFLLFLVGLRTILGIPPLNRLWRKDLRERDRKVRLYEEELDIRMKEAKIKAELDDVVERNRRANTRRDVG